jgi:hypothetical protein
MARKAGSIVSDIYRRQIRNNDGGKIDFGAALLEFDEKFSDYFFGPQIRNWSDIADNYSNGVRHKGTKEEKGQEDFKSQFQQNEKNGSDLVSPDNMEGQPDQTHHFAAYLSAGINMGPLTDAATLWHYMGDRNDGNQADTALARAAYNYGVYLRKDPGGRLGGIEAWITKNICR